MTIEQDLKECFATALKEEKRGKKHKGLLVTKPSIEIAQGYIERAMESLKFCDLYNKMGADYKIPEEWFYALYYCALAILAKFGVESIKGKELIEYDDEFIKRIFVHKEKDKESDVDERERARYGSWIKSEKIREKYASMMEICREAISQCEEIVFSDKELKVPEELLSG